MRIGKACRAALLAAFTTALLAAPAFSQDTQSNPTQTGVGPRGTKVGPSTTPPPVNAGSSDNRGTSGNNLGVPPSGAQSQANTASRNQSAIKPNRPQQGVGQ